MATQKKKRPTRRVHPEWTKPASSPFVDLPNEILTMITQTLSKKDLFSVARTCRRLNSFATSLWLGSPRQYQKLYSKFDEHDEGTSLPFACFQDLRLCVVNKPFIPSMTLVFSTKYHYASLGDFIRYITTIPIPQRPVVHIKLRFFQMWQSLLRSADANAFNIFCTQLVKSECVASFEIPYHHLGEMQQWLDAKGPHNKPLFRPPAFTTLTEVHIAPFSNALIDWFVRSANASLIKKLSLGGFLGQRRCAIPIRRLHLPHLRHLTILGGLFTVSEISSFLSNAAHSSLESISFGSISQLLSEMDTRSEEAFLRLPPNKGLPNLTTIAATSVLLLSFLPALEEACPNLERVDLLSAGWKAGLGEECREVLSWISRRPAIRCVGLPMQDFRYRDWKCLIADRDGTVVLPQVVRLACPCVLYALPFQSDLANVSAVFPGVVEYELPRKPALFQDVVEEAKMVWPALKRLVFYDEIHSLE
ncbi:hypothetical protein EV421DRAFT_1901395 [Armillaria borealis]|uniref:F-box domain-containing protein n=1 Tax=Armillaria borealis TaxID=47425 RepID=A0AA39JTQ4_9AGAR|nr:hypothetical protein EV421DRAFT_1901395 [Armillaria borealis]